MLQLMISVSELALVAISAPPCRLPTPAHLSLHSSSLTSVDLQPVHESECLDVLLCCSVYFHTVQGEDFTVKCQA